MIVHASAHRAQLGVDGVDIIARRIRRVIMTEVDILVLSLHRPGRVELVLDAAAQHVAGLPAVVLVNGVYGAGFGELVRLVPVGKAAGEIDERRPKRIAQPAANRAELVDRPPVHANVAVIVGDAGAVVDVRALKIGLDAQHQVRA